MTNSWRLSASEWKQLFKHTVKQFRADDMAGEAAKLAFYLTFALFPFLLSLTAVLGLVLENVSLLESGINEYFSRVASASVADLVAKTLAEVSIGTTGGKISFGLLFSMWAASRGMLGLMRALNIAYEVKEGRKWWKARLVAIGLTLAVAILMAIALFSVLMGGPSIVELLGKLRLEGIAASVWNILRWPAALVFVLAAFNFLYIYAPNLKRRKWHHLMPGTVLGVALWLLASFAFKIYLTHFDRYSVTYGSIGAVITLLMWLYLSAAAILVGAEMNSELELEAGAIEHRHPPAEEGG